MLITVCIPTYNRPKLIKRAIESVLSQWQQDVELLIHDNSENSLTQEVVREYNDNRITYFRHKKNIGLVGNWNSLIDRANGKYLKFLNDDDWLEKGCLARFSSVLNLYPDIGVVTCRAKYVDVDGVLVKEDYVSGNGYSYYISSKNVAFMWLNQALPVRTPTHTMYNKDAAKEISGFDVDFDYARDVFLALNIAYKKGAYFIEEESLVSFMKHSGQDVFSVPAYTRIRDQHNINFQAVEMIVDKGSEIDIVTINSSISFRECVLLFRGLNFRGGAYALNDWFHQGRKLMSILYFVMKNIFRSFSLSKFDNIRIYK